MKIDDIVFGKKYLVDEPDGNDTKSEVIVENYKIQTDMYYINFVKDNSTIPIPGFAVRTMKFHEING